jgi:hypothetical protein
MIVDLHARKLKVIEYLIHLSDERVFQKIESTILASTKKVDVKSTMKPLTNQEIINRALISENDYKAGRIISQDELEAKSENW